MMAVRTLTTYDNDADLAAKLHEVLSPSETLTNMRTQILDVLRENADEIFAYEGSSTRDEVSDA